MLKSIDQTGDLLNAIRKLDIAENFEALTDPIGIYIVNNREKISNEERTRRAQNHSKANDEKNQRTDQVNSELTVHTDPIEALEESYNTPLNPPTEEDIEAEKILHNKYIQDELDKTIEDLQANGGLSDAAIEAEIAAQEEAEAYEEEPVLTFNDANGNLHFPQEIVSILENFQKVESSKWNLPVEEKTAVFPNSLDSATDRRFHMKIGFKPLDKDGISLLCKSYFEKFEFTNQQINEIYNSGDVTPGDFGSLYGRIRFTDPEDVNPDFICSELIKLVKGKTRSWENNNPIGFCS